MSFHRVIAFERPGEDIQLYDSDPAVPEPDDPVPPLTVAVAERVAKYRPTEVDNKLADQLRSEPGPIVVAIEHLLDWSPEDRQAVMRFIVGLGQRATVCRRIGDSEEGGLLRTVIRMMERRDALEPTRRLGIRARSEAIEAAVLAHPHALRAACHMIHTRLVALGVNDQSLQSLEDEASELLTPLNGGLPVADDDVTLDERLIESPLPLGAVAPDGWDVSMDGIANNGIMISRVPLLVTGRFVDIRDDSENIGITWWRDGHWPTRIVDARTLATSKITRLAQWGIPVNQINSTKLIRYVADFIAANDSVIPRQQTTHHFGWKGERGELGYLCGRSLITGSNSEGRPATDSPSVFFVGESDGGEQLADAISSAGTFENWQLAVERLQSFDSVVVPLVASFAALLLKAVDAPSFAVSLAGATSTGKTTVLRVCASILGTADELAPNSIIGTFNSTRLGLEELARVRNDMPVLLDDTQAADKNKKMIGDLIYHLTGGQSRRRASDNRVHAVETFRNTLILTGETPVADFVDAGVRARVIEDTKSPFGLADEETAQLVADIRTQLKSNYGHAGPRFAESLCGREWKQLQERYVELCGTYREKAGSNSVASRQAEYFALLHLAAKLLYTARILTWDATPSVEAMWIESMEKSSQPDSFAEATRQLWNHYVRNRSRFIQDGGDQSQSRPDGRVTNVDGEPVVAFFSDVFNSILRQNGFAPGSILAQLDDRGQLRTSPNRGRRRRMRVNGELVDLIAIRQAAFTEVPGENEESESEAPTVHDAEPANSPGSDASPPASSAAGTAGTSPGTKQLVPQ